MSAHRIAVLVGSLRKAPFNRQLASALSRLAPAHFSFHQAELGDLPAYNQDDDGQPHAAAICLETMIGESQGLQFVTPEYNRSIPGVLNNAIDHVSRPYGQIAWAGKPAGVISASLGAIGTALAQQHPRNVLANLDVPTLGQPEAFIHAERRPVRCRRQHRGLQQGLPTGLDGRLCSVDRTPRRLRNIRGAYPVPFPVKYVNARKPRASNA